MKKIGKTLPCRDSPLRPIQTRATTNSLCNTNIRQRHFVSTKTIQVGNTLIPIPCFLLPHIEEFTLLTKQVGYIQAVKILAAKYNVNIKPTLQNVTRYVYPNVDIGVLPPVIQFHISFQLGETAPITSSVVLPDLANDNWSVMINDARYVRLCNDDTTTFSHLYTEMKTLAKYWVSKLPIFDEPFYYALVNSSRRPLNTHSGCLLLQNDRIIFVPVIFNPLFLFYNAYSENTPINILYIGSKTVLQAKLEDFYENVKNSCEIKKKYERFITRV
jgi:hypothetical protein